jgi:predicted nucleic acid-binding protein
MNIVFLDTAGLLALWDIRDQRHEDARRVFEGLRQERARYFSTTFVFLECGNAASRRPYRDAVIRLYRALESRDRLIAPSEQLLREVWGAYEQRPAERAGIVDHVSFLVMRQMGIRRVFTTDRHFKQAGFETLF